MNVLTRAALTGLAPFRRQAAVTTALTPPGVRPSASAPRACVPGTAAEGADKPADETKPAPAEDDIDAREAALNEREAAIAAREAAVAEREAAFGEDDCEDGEEGDCQEMSGQRGQLVASARGRERARCAAILGHPKAAGNFALAAHLAFGTSLSRNQAVAALDVGGQAAATGLGARMAGLAGAKPTASAPAPSAAAKIAGSWDRAFAKVAR